VRISISLGLVSTGFFLVALNVVWRFHPPNIEIISTWSTSPQVKDRAGQVIFQTVGLDDHWRIPIDLDDVSPWLIKATIAAEDQRFLEHDGVDSTAVFRAVYQNVASAEVVSGASTLSMQLCRMMHRRPRSLATKFIEAVQAVQLEQQLSKRQILMHYLNVAPYGGNVLGVEAAAQRYFNKSAADLSLGEATLIAGLPQSPSRFRPDRFPVRARKRQEYVLDRMHALKLISEKQQANALREPIQLVKRKGTASSHVSWLALSRRKSGGQTTIDSSLQAEVQQAVERHSQRLPVGADIAVVVLDIETSEIRALIGSSDFLDPTDGQINGVLARRSPGSALKPFIYAAAFEAQRLAPESIITDQPIERAGWTPDNFDRTFQGNISTAQALRASRNVPAILVMEAIGVARCVGVLESVGVKLPQSAESRGGLSVCVGTVETTLLDVTNGYATLGRNGVYSAPRLFIDEPIQKREVLSTTTVRAINQILSSEMRRPNGIDHVTRVPQFMWKTGTSSGRRDACAVGHNGRYAIGVWTGRFSGAGHSQFVGRISAEPLLAELFCHKNLVGSSNAWADSIEQSIVVTRPIVFEPTGNAPRIQSPANNATYVATEETATIPVVCQNARDARWFLNGRLLGDSELRRLTLTNGSYELRCLAENKSHGVSFRVESAD
jgi:penicillin-binding protein 1C